MTTLNSKIILVSNIKIDKDYKNVMNYNENQMLELCNNNKVVESSTYSYIRERNTIIVNFTYAQCLQANYIAYQNPDYSNKWFFAWIDEVNYKSNASTELSFTIDSWSTWFGNWSASSCFVEREHVNDDTLGLHTIPESLETGEYINVASFEESNYISVANHYIVLAMSSIPGQSSSQVNRYNGIYSGLSYLVFKNPIMATGFILACDNVQWGSIGDKSYRDAIISVFLIPKSMADDHLSEQQNYEGWLYYQLLSTTVPQLLDNKTLTTPTVLGGSYVPKNNKLLTYPYRYLIASNNAGTDVEYKYEFFSSSTPKFKVYGNISTGCSIKIVPQDYKGISENYEESINGAKLPTCAWSSNVYLNWLTQNGVNIALGSISSIAQIASGVALMSTGAGALAGAGQIGSGLMGIANQMGQVYEHSKVPNQAKGNVNSSDIMFSLDKNNISYYHMGIKEEYAKIIDDYFTRFGYKVNSVKIPNITGRPIWNFVKVGSGEDVVDGIIPTSYLEKINNAFRNGVTIWHNHSNIGNYLLDNSL